MNQRTSSPPNLDGRVTFALILMSIITGGFAFFSFKYATDGTCVAKIVFKSGPYFTGEIIRFTVETSKAKAAKTIVWQFGDSMRQMENGATCFHIFTAPGLQKMSVTINGICTKDTLINIHQQIKRPDLIPQFTGPQTTFVGEQVAFKDSTPNAKIWEWRFGETFEVDAITKNPKYAYTQPGLKTVILVVNGEIKGELQVFVQNKPKPVSTPGGTKNFTITAGERPLIPAIKPPVSADTLKVPPIAVTPPPNLPASTQPPVSATELEIIIRNVADGKMNAGNFETYLCDPNIPVVYNGSALSFSDFCSKIRRSKRIKKMEVIPTFKNGTSCIKLLTVNIDKKWIVLPL